MVEPLKDAFTEEQWQDYKAGLAAQVEAEKQAQEAAEQQRQQAQEQAAAKQAAQQAEADRQSKLTKVRLALLRRELDVRMHNRQHHFYQLWHGY